MWACLRLPKAAQSWLLLTCSSSLTWRGMLLSLNDSTLSSGSGKTSPCLVLSGSFIGDTPDHIQHLLRLLPSTGLYQSQTSLAFRDCQTCLVQNTWREWPDGVVWYGFGAVAQTLTPVYKDIFGAGTSKDGLHHGSFRATWRPCR